MTNVEHPENTAEEADDIKLKRETDAARRRRLKAAWEAVMATPEGRAVLWDIIAGAGLLETPLAFKSDAEIAVELTIANVGRQDYARKLFASIGEDYPAMLALMQKENA